MSSQLQPAQSIKKQFVNKPSGRGLRTTVLHLAADLEPGDPAREAVDLAILTMRAGWRALIASRGGLLVTEAERAAVRHTRMPLGSNSIMAGWRNRIQLAALVQRERPVLLHAHGIEPTMHVFGIIKSHHLPLIVDITRPVSDRAAMRKHMKKLDKLNTSIRVPSEYMAKHLIETFQWPAARIQVIPHGIDLQWNYAGSISTERLQALSRLWRMPEHGTVIVMPMPFAEGGGHRQLLEALAQLKREDIYCILVGDNRPSPGVRDQIEQEVTRLGLDGKVIMPDYCLDWPAACWLSNLVVSANTAPRGQGMELLIAQAIGRPVIVTDCGANREMVDGGVTSWIIPPDNVNDLANALRAVITLDNTSRLDLTHRTRGFINNTFPQANWFNSIMDMYDSILLPTERRKAAA
jgi:glycosyltransferase involved in cell wall biosynthesis